MPARIVVIRDAELCAQPNALTGDRTSLRRISSGARATIIAFTIAMALPLCIAQAQPRGGFGGGPGFGGPGFGGPGFGGRGPGFGPGFGSPGWGGGWHGGWGGAWGWPFVGGALLGLGLGLLPYYAAPPPAYYPPAYYPPAYYPPAYYAPSPGYYPYPYGYYQSPYTPGYSGYADPPAPYAAPQAYAQQGYHPALDPHNCGTPDEPRPCTH